MTGIVFSKDSESVVLLNNTVSHSNCTEMKLQRHKKIKMLEKKVSKLN